MASLSYHLSAMLITERSQEKDNEDVYGPLRNKLAVWKYTAFWREDESTHKPIPYANKAVAR